MRGDGRCGPDEEDAVCRCREYGCIRPLKDADGSDVTSVDPSPTIEGVSTLKVSDVEE